MAAIVAVLWNGLLGILGSVVWQAIIALGVGIVTYQGADTSLDYFKNLAVTNLTALPPGNWFAWVYESRQMRFNDLFGHRDAHDCSRLKGGCVKAMAL